MNKKPLDIIMFLTGLNAFISSNETQCLYYVNNKTKLEAYFTIENNKKYKDHNQISLILKICMNDMDIINYYVTKIEHDDGIIVEPVVELEKRISDNLRTNILPFVKDDIKRAENNNFLRHNLNKLVSILNEYEKK